MPSKYTVCLLVTQLRVEKGGTLLLNIGSSCFQYLEHFKQRQKWIGNEVAVCYYEVSFTDLALN